MHLSESEAFAYLEQQYDELHNEDVRAEICTNLSGFFNVLSEWKQIAETKGASNAI